MMKEPNNRAPGIYFDLDEGEYHNDKALGSTNMRKLMTSAPDFWWNSWMNPLREEETPTPAKIRGTAMHKMVLQGADKFNALYVRRPNDPEDASPADKAAVTKAINAKYKGSGKTVLHGDVHDRIRVASAMITKNPELKTAFEGGAPEVSVFFDRKTKSGGVVRCKARFDYLKPRGIADLKSITNTRDIDFEQCCRNALAWNGYYIQARHYMDARAAMAALIADGAVHGDHDPAFIKSLAAQKAFAFVFIFFQADGAPITWPTKISPGNSILDVADGRIEDALTRYLQFMEAFGPNQMWLKAEPIRELSIDELPKFF